MLNFQDYLSNLCDSLWSVVMRPSRVQSDMKKSHGAAAYLASFLARAKYANAKLVLTVIVSRKSN